MIDKTNMIDRVSEILAKPMVQQALFFKEMLTPKLISLAYWLCLIAVIGTGLGKMFSNGLSGFIGGIVYIAVGVILARVGGELIILFFKINENIETVANNTTVQTTTSAGPAKAIEAKKTTKKTTKRTTKKS